MVKSWLPPLNCTFNCRECSEGPGHVNVLPGVPGENTADWPSMISVTLSTSGELGSGLTVYLNCGSLAPGGNARSVNAAARFRKDTNAGLMFIPPDGLAENCEPERVMYFCSALS